MFEASVNTHMYAVRVRIYQMHIVCALSLFRYSQDTLFRKSRGTDKHVESLL